MQRSASFNATSTVPLKITILEDARPGGVHKEGLPLHCVQNSKSLSNCSLISKIVGKGDGGTRNIISHLVPTTATFSLPIDAGAAAPERGLEQKGSCDSVERFRDYYV